MDAAGRVTTGASERSLTPPALEPTTVPIAIIGTDAVLAAAPATPVQLAHACMRAGYTNVIPASWGDELIAAAVLRRLPQFGPGPAVQCSCPIVAHRLLTVGGDLRPVLLALVPPPVAVARYVKTLAAPLRARITYIGGCPGASDDSIDIRMSADALLAMLAERGISPANQPRAFESIIPPDRRRFRSQPGGVPTADALWTDAGSRTLVELTGDDLVADLAQQLLTGDTILIDAATRLGCLCSGAVGGSANPRATVVALEPPRATAPIVDERTPIDLDLPVPALPRTPIDVAAVPTTPSHPTPAQSRETAPAPRPSAAKPSGLNGEARPSRLSTPVVPRPVLSTFPLARDLQGRALPRAYVARRRSTPKGIPVLPPEPSIPEAPSEWAAPMEAPTPVASIVPQEATAAVVTEPTEQAPPATPVPSEPPAPTEVPEPTAATESVAPASAETPKAPSVGAAEPVAASGPAVVTPIETPATGSVLVVSDPTFARDASTGPGPSRPRAPRPTPPPPAPAPAASSMSRGQLVLVLLAAAAIAISAATVIALIVSRSANPPAALGTTPTR